MLTVGEEMIVRRGAADVVGSVVVLLRKNEACCVFFTSKWASASACAVFNHDIL